MMLSKRRLAVVAAIGQVPQLTWVLGPEYWMPAIGCGFVCMWAALIALQEKYQEGGDDA